MAKKRAEKPVVVEVPPATYDDAESLVPAGAAPSMPVAPEAPPEAPPEADPVVPHHEWFRTLSPGRVFVDGCVAVLAPGSLVSEATHDLAALRAAGVAMEPCDRIQRPLDAYGESP